MRVLHVAKYHARRRLLAGKATCQDLERLRPTSSKREIHLHVTLLDPALNRALDADAVRAAVKQLSRPELERARLAWMPNYEVAAGLEHEDQRKDTRGAPMEFRAHTLYRANFAILYRIAELLAELDWRRRADRARREHGDGRFSVRRAAEDGHWPSREEMRIGYLRRWGVWGERLPSRATIQRYRRLAVGDMSPAWIDLDILRTVRSTS